MSIITYYYVRPTDSLFVRGNMAFGDSGEHGSSNMPPPPSLFAGAFRSALLGRDAAQLSAFLGQGCCTDVALAKCLGTPEVPGEFGVTWLSLAGDPGTGGMPESITPLPADLLMLGNSFATLVPREVASGVVSAGDLPMRATLASAKQEKPTSGIFLRSQGLAQHLKGHCPDTQHGLASKHLFSRDSRLGIGLNTDSRTVEEGLIYTTEGYAFSPSQITEKGHFISTGFLVGLQGVADLLPAEGVLRLGGDGRSAYYRRVDFTAPKLPQWGSNTRFRVLLQTPGLFSQGWLPEGVSRQADAYRLQGDGFTARLACAALGRRETVSGWDLYHWKPKPAQAAAPAGSVYWFDEFKGSADKLAEWVANGLSTDDRGLGLATRRAEGYNCALLGAWN